MSVSLAVLDAAKEKLLHGDFSLATSYYQRARSEGIPADIVNLRYLTKNYLVYPIEYENSCEYFDALARLYKIAEHNEDFAQEYKLALNSLLNLKQLFMRALSLFYFSDIEVCFRGSVVVHQVAGLLSYIRTHKGEILGKDIYGIKKYCPYADLFKFARELNIIEAYSMNLLLSYTAVQDQEYLGKKYSALTVDYGYFAVTDVYSRDCYRNWAVLKPRFFVIGGEAYYDDLLRDYHSKLQELKGFNSPKELRRELTELIRHKYSKDGSNAEFFAYAKHFEKDNTSRSSIFGTLNKITNIVNPFNRLNIMSAVLDKRKVCSFELDNYFTRKMIFGVCDMLSAGQGWSLDTVRWGMAIAGCFVVGLFAYAALAVGMRLGLYWGVTIAKH